MAVDSRKTGKRRDSRSQIFIQPLDDRCVRQVCFIQELSRGSGISSQKPLELHHQSSVFTQEFQNLLRSGGHAVEIVCR
jgi:hypothetical protein